ncbi:efflux RND transporter periplasmic adaptor subunit [Oceanirhabdus sp. W0125-5]|uniref:efflux RND transporter periplasmic adaptor subunit n=1 Tax=Oceanirhabdus sp. W0125-5 TaxID=2999116 RepID=UPI0022F2C6E3|nr:efflux RND transporter periplasmic adaptor subunit [Oceanirhabdus sp. W0125-5]WBW95613.1 efflux RND transporter periplasmic adaptor subunit [Oceanirhabdus sp. W0125-5]
MGKNIKKIIAISLVGFSLFFSGCSKAEKESNTSATLLSNLESLNYKTFKVDKGEIVQEHKCFGNIESLNRHILFSKVPGARLEERYVKSESKVKKGDIIAKLYSVDLEDEIELQKLTVQVAEINFEKLNNEDADKYEKKLAEVTLEYQRKKLAQLLKKEEGLTFYSPIDGVITRMITYQKGDEIKEDDKVAVIDDTDNIVLCSSIGESVEKYFLGMDAIITHKGMEYSGIVTKIDKDIIISGVKSSQVFIEFKDKKPHELEIDEALYFKVIGEKKENALRIPSECLYDAFDYKYVFVLENGMKLKRNVEVGMVTDEYVEIISGLKENEEVIYKIEER